MKRKRRLLLSSAQLSAVMNHDAKAKATSKSRTNAKAMEEKASAKKRRIVQLDHQDYEYKDHSYTPNVMKSRQNKTPIRYFRLLLFAVAVIVLFKSSDSIATTEAFVSVVPISQSQYQRKNHQIISIYSPSSSSSTTTTTTFLQAAFSSSPSPSSVSDLQSLTVKELKELVKTTPDPPERGTLSKLKKKQDLIEYLEDKLLLVTQNDKKDEELSNLLEEETNNGGGETAKGIPNSQKARLQKMPPMNHKGSNDNHSDNDLHTTTTMTTHV